MSQRLVEGLVHGRDALPQFAESRQRVLSAVLETDNGQPVQIMHTEASVWIFDAAGKIGKGLAESLALAMQSWHDDVGDDTVVALAPHASKQKLRKEYRWEPTAADIDCVVSDIWPKQKADRLKLVKGVRKRKPPLTFEATAALNEASAQFWKISAAIQHLKEPSQRAFGFEARERSNQDPDFAHLYRAIADMSDWHLAVQRQRKTGKGVWYALVEVLVWRDGIGEAAERYYQRCNGRDEAVRTVRELLATHAEKFTDYATVEAELLTELEWEQLAYPD